MRFQEFSNRNSSWCIVILSIHMVHFHHPISCSSYPISNFLIDRLCGTFKRKHRSTKFSAHFNIFDNEHTRESAGNDAKMIILGKSRPNLEVWARRPGGLLPRLIA